MALEAFMQWLPTRATMVEDLTFVPPDNFDFYGMEKPWEGMKLHFYDVDNHIAWFDGYGWSRWTALHWQYPLCAVAAYVVLIPLLLKLMEGRKAVDLGSFPFYWNTFLSVFSMAGFAYCAPVILSELATNGFYFTTCAPAPWYGAGRHGLFVALFIYSKFFELVDTAIILLAKRQLMFLHWWHHVTVLLYCWHAYATQIATGLWFATMNYFVHSVMYGYYAAMGSAKMRPKVKKFAIYITLLQLLQMVVGIFVTVKAVMYQASGHPCRVNKTNSIMGLAMYASYFVLFFIFFLGRYVSAEKPKKA